MASATAKLDDRQVQIRARAFTGGKVEEQYCMVDPDGTVRVWDGEARHYTTCHILDDAALKRARKAAANKAPVVVCEVGTCGSHDAATNKSISVDIVKDSGLYRLVITRRSRWEGEGDTTENPPETFGTLAAARSEAESICASRYGDPDIRYHHYYQYS